MSEGSGEGAEFLQRWSRRKRDSRQPGAVAVDEAAPMLPENTAAAALPQDAAPPAPADADMPPLDSLDEHSDFSAFLSPRVSEALRRQALRKLFHLPAFNINDGLNDYDEDYTQAAGVARRVAGQLAGLGSRADGASDTKAAPPVVAAGESDVVGADGENDADESGNEEDT